MAALVKRDSHDQHCDPTLQSWEPSASPTPDAEARLCNFSHTLQENITKNGPDLGLSIATEPSMSLSEDPATANPPTVTGGDAP